MLKDDLPEIYNDLLPKEFLELNPQEKLATCSNCYKTKKGSPKPHYNPVFKCCTYYPFIPNYLVGAILMSGKQEILNNLILDRKYVLPIGVCAPADYQKQFRLKSFSDFGNCEDLVCPFYAKNIGGCSIWRFRGHECATFFCASSYGQKGEGAWQNIRDYLFDVEMELSQSVMVQKGYTPREIDKNLSYVKRPEDDVDASPELSAIKWAELWLHHEDDIVSYFKDCFQFVTSHKDELKKELNDRPSSKKLNTRILKSVFMGRSL